MKNVDVNILLLGKSGAGKSSLANYLYGEDVLKTGDGSPVTAFGVQFEKITIERDDYTLNIFDAPGVEPENYGKWKKELSAFLKERQGQLDPAKWVHGAFYIINAGSSRIEPVEIEIIRSFPKEFLMPISVVFTNCDNANDEKINDLYRLINEQLPYIEISQICSVTKKKRSGAVVEPFGRDELLQSHAKKVAFYVANRLGVLFFGEKVPAAINSIFYNLLQELKSSNISILKIIKEGDKAFERLEPKLDELRDELENSDIVTSMHDLVDSLENYLDGLGVPDDQLQNLVENFFDEMEPIMNAEIEKMETQFDKIINDVESGSFSEKASAIFKGIKIGGKMIFNLMGFIEDIFNTVKYEMLDSAKNKADLCQERLAAPELFLDEYK
jgi:Predicted GTPase